MARVLVVEDTEEIRRIVRITLELEGHTVVEAADGQEALQVPTTAHDIVILDIMMPGLDGFAVLDALRARGKDAPRVIMLTAKPAEQDRQRALAKGAVGYLGKPFEPGDLIGEVERVLRSSEESLTDRRDHEIYLSRIISQLDRATEVRHN